jgi:syntaxin 5
VIKQSLAKINQELTSLKALSKSNSHPDQVGRHEEGVVVLLQQKLGDTTSSFREVLELRSKNLAASRERTSAFTSQVSQPSSLPVSRTDSPLYAPGQQNGAARQPYQMTQAARSDILSLDMPSEGSSALTRGGGASAQQLMMLEEGAQGNEYIQARSSAIENIERTMTELGGIFTQLAQMVSEQGEQIQRIDADTDAVVEVGSLLHCAYKQNADRLR